ncbi:MAG: S9 family peptidase [Fimbriimonadaceae bacterium]|nr:S9 family peptidase [Fimbriimonadaceae bacterium]
MRLKWYSILAIVSLAAFSIADTGLERATSREKNLKFDDLFPRRSLLGKTARIMGWSPDDRYLAYAWNTYKDQGSDLWLFDSKTGKSTRITSPDLFMKFDGDIKDAVKQYNEEQERWEKWEKLSDQEYRDAVQNYEEEQKKDKTPRKNYGGVGSISWANKSNEFLMNYKGDIYRWKVGDKEPTRLTDTSDSESNIEYLPDDKGFVFQRGGAVYRMRFDSPLVVQVTPILKDGKNFGGFSISPQGDKMLLYAFKAGPPERQVDYITYRERFAKVMKTSRGVADDDFSGETYIYLVDIREETIGDKSKENEPLEIWNWKGGEEWQQTSINSDPWSKDGDRFVFATWKRDAREFKVLEANLTSKKIDTIYEGTSKGEHGTPGLANPFYAGDDKSVIALLDKSGWRQAHLLDGKGGERQITLGNFEVYPLQLAADGKNLLVRSSKEDLSRYDFYRVNVDNGSMERLSKGQGVMAFPNFAEKSDKFAAIFSSWKDLREMVINDGKTETKVTDSHRSEEFWKVAQYQPELVTFKNRNNQEIHAFQMLPKDLKPGEKRPLFIYVYGGPLGIDKSVVDGSFGSTNYMFAQYLTDVLGYITVTIDPRGQSGYSAEFGGANWEQVGKPQAEDIVDLIKYYDAKGMVDRNKVGLNGWSFGGFQTQYTMYTQPGWVTLGIAGAGPTEWQNYNNWYTGGVIFNTPKNKPEEMDKFSLTHLAKNLTHPLLLLHGIEDTNVLFQDTIHVYRKLLQAGKGPLVELALDPTGGHGMGGDMNTRDRHAIYLAFILKHWESDRPMP